MTCEQVRAMLAAFMADEIPPGESRLVQEHLDACAPCAGFRRFEDAFDGALKRGLGASVAPASLILGVQRGIGEEDSSRRRSPFWFQAPALKQWALAAGIIIAMLAPFSLGYRLGLFVPEAASTEDVRVVRGTLVCSACEKMGVPLPNQRGCRLHGHHAALKCEDTGLWEFVETDSTRPLLTDASRIGDEVELRGVFMEDLHYVKVSSVRFLSGEARTDLDL